MEFIFYMYRLFLEFCCYLGFLRQVFGFLFVCLFVCLSVCVALVALELPL